MNLPNFFFADLPPEATLSPVMISDACRTLKRNRELYLAHRSTQNMVDFLSELAENWLQPEFSFRKFALESATGFSRETLTRGLDNFFKQLTRENFHTLLIQEFGDAKRLDAIAATAIEQEQNRAAMVQAPEFLVHICAGNLPNPALTSIVFGLLLRSAQFVKCASGASFLPRLFAHSIRELDPKLGACLEIAEWRGGNLELENALFAEADCVTATGSDETLEKIRARLPLKIRFAGHGLRVSFGYVARESLRDETIAETVSRAADDVIAWDQNGCLSPHVFYVEERGAIESDKFAELLAVELAKREEIEPRGKILTETSAAIASRRAIYETLAIHRADAKIWASQNSTAWTVVFEHEIRFQFSPLNRFVFVKPVSDLKMALQGADEIRGKVSTVGIDAPPEKFQQLAKEFARWGATRICALGRMQNPPLNWRHDGRPVLGDIVLWTDLEL
jgi:hypothetical protein